MKYFYYILVLFLVFIQHSFGAEKYKLPKTLKQAVRFLNRDCPDSIKQKIKVTPDEELDDLFYPTSGNYRVIYDWFYEDDNKFLGIQKYFIDKGLTSYFEDITISAFKEYLNYGKYDENKIISKYILIQNKMIELDKIRYTTDTLYGNYIPKDMNDCFRVLDNIINDSTKNDIRKMTADSFFYSTYRGFGMYLRNTWQLWGGSRLSKYLYGYGYCEAEGMSVYILDNYYNYLQKNEIKLTKNDTFCDQYYKKQRIEEAERNKEKFSKYKIGDTVEYNYSHGYVSKKQENAEYDEKCIAKGIILAKNDTFFNLKIKLITTCSIKGLVYSDNKNIEIWNLETKRWEKPKEREIIYVHKRQVYWYYYRDWEIIEDE